MKICCLKNISFFILLFSSNILSAQNSLDSLETILEKTSGIDRIDILIELSESYIQESPNKSIEYAQEAYFLMANNNKKQKEQFGPFLSLATQ